jgi:hypothetical protein
MESSLAQVCHTISIFIIPSSVAGNKVNHILGVKNIKLKTSNITGKITKDHLYKVLEKTK